MVLSYRRPGRDDSWCPSVIGMSKRDLLKEVLSVFGMYVYLLHLPGVNSWISSARSKSLQNLASEWQDTLKKAMNDDS